MSGIKKKGEKGEKGKRRKGEKPGLYFSFPSSCLGTELCPKLCLGPLYFMCNLPKMCKFFGKRELGKWFPSRSLGTRMKILY
jgi:hypothetical protein